jgi:hypothetical protein
MIVMLAILVGVSIWVRYDAVNRGMSRHWGSGVLLMAIVFLPLYFAVRKPRPAAKCTACGKSAAASLSFCEACEQGRAGRIFA